MWQHVLAGVVVAAILAVAVSRIVLAAKGKGGCGCGNVFDRDRCESPDDDR